MLLIKIPVEGPIENVEIENSVFWETFDLFGSHPIEQVRIGTPLGPTGYLVAYYGNTEDEMVVMLVDGDGIAYRLPVNPRASILYQTERHNAKIYGDAYLCMSICDPYEGDMWADISSAYSDPAYWDTVCRSFEFRP